MIWIVAATFGRDHIGAYGNPTIRTPSPDALAGRAIRFDRHYSAGFPTMPTRADHQTGRWTMSFMGWKPLPSEATIHPGGDPGGQWLSHGGFGGHPGPSRTVGRSLLLHRVVLAGIRRRVGVAGLWELARCSRIRGVRVAQGPCHLLRRSSWRTPGWVFC
ncbi:MAG: sulfatase-like hydrolase/transferase [Dehalococcoidia bacterium]|nr:sulfatase-like hydrolase/transferase [Dehalococcoidia bacterium]